MNQIIVATTKWGTDYYDASAPESFAKSSLHILTGRFNSGFYNNDIDTEWYGRAAEVVAKQSLDFVTVYPGKKYETKTPIAFKLLIERTEFEYEHVDLQLLVDTSKR